MAPSISIAHIFYYRIVRPRETIQTHSIYGTNDIDPTQTEKKDANELFSYERYTKSHKKSYTRILIHTAKSNASQLTK